jgi:hypothetical protein
MTSPRRLCQLVCSLSGFMPWLAEAEERPRVLEALVRTHNGYVQVE